MNRRSFIKNLMAGSVALTVYGPSGLPKAVGEGTKRPKRYLINVIRAGGSDTHWFHSAFAPSQVLRAGDAFLDPSGPGSSRDYPKFSTQYINADTDGNDGNHHQFTLREPEVSGRFYTSDTTSHYFGSPFHHLFRKGKLDTGQEIMSKMSIWKGIQSSCLHNVDNPVILHGLASSYALSFSALIAARLAQDYARPLHYTVLESNPENAFLNFAMNTGYSSPSCIPGIEGLKSLTGDDPNSFSEVSRRDAISDAIKTISGAAMSGRLKLKNSLSNLNLFNTSFRASQTVAGTHLDEDIELLYAQYSFRVNCLKQISDYFNAVNTDLKSKFDSYVPSGWGTETITGRIAGANATAAGTDPAALATSMALFRSGNASSAQISSLSASLRASLNAINNHNTDGRPLYFGLIDKFAVAGFLVRKDLSAVVDFREGAGGSIIDDAHALGFEGFFKELVFYSAYQSLLIYLDEVKNINPDTYPGETLLDATHVVMHTEMDRSPWMAEHKMLFGTNHSLYTTSTLMAGYGIFPGRVIGGQHRGFNDREAFPNTANQSFRFTQALPINMNTGVPDPNGKVVSIKSIAPTLLAMFDVKMPCQQITDQEAVPAVANPKMGSNVGNTVTPASTKACSTS